MNQIFDFFNKLNGGQKAVVVGGFSIVLVFLISIMMYSQGNKSNLDHSYIVAKDLSKSEVMVASNELETVGVPFSLSGTGDSMIVKTSKEYINIAKIKLVSSGALKGDHKGWEIFDKSSIGETSFQNKIKYLRAIEGELSKSLESLIYVQRASVKVVLPKDSIFTDTKLKASSSVMLTLSQGRYLTANQIKGVKSFIASAIQGLNPMNVQLISQTGELLEDYSGDDEQGFKKQVQYKNRLQTSLEKKVIELLEGAMGTGNVIAKANVDLDYTKKQVQEETFSPEGTVRSKQSDETITNESKTTAGGNAQSNDLASSAGGSGKKNNEKIVTTTNYEISKKITSTTNGAYATLNRLSVAVTFNEAILKGVENPKSYLVDIEDLVKDAVGYNKKRGDRVTVKSFKFAATQGPGEEVKDGTVPTVKYYLNEFGPYLQYIVIAILLLLIYKKFTNFAPATISTSASSAGATGGSSSTASGEEDDEDLSLEADRIDMEQLKAKQEAQRAQIQNKVLAQLHDNGQLDDESKIRFETLIEQINSDITSSPDGIANMIEILLDRDA